MCELLHIIETRSPDRSRLHGSKPTDRRGNKLETLVASNY